VNPDRPPGHDVRDGPVAEPGRHPETTPPPTRREAVFRITRGGRAAGLLALLAVIR
jgi:hypothetical protein